MNYSQYIIYIPYTIAWGICRLYRKLFKKEKSVVFYCGAVVDYIVLKNVLKHVPDVKIIAKKKKVQKELRQKYGVKNCGLYPAFPDVIVMARHVARKFPGSKLVKIGTRHGAYHFKDFVSAKRYNRFDKFFVTSQKEVELAAQKGITSAVAVGFPKLDGAFDGSLTEKKLDNYRERLNLDKSKSTIIFTATWERSRMSAVDKWAHRLGELTDDYNVLVTLHPWVSQKYVGIIKNTQKIHYIADWDILPYLMISDVMIADMSSIIAEFCALDKPIVGYRVTEGTRLSAEIQRMLKDISHQVDTFEEMKAAIKRGLKTPNELSAARQKYNKIMFDELDGNAGKRAADIIKSYLK